MKYIHVYALFLISVFHTSCRQNQTTLAKENIKSETKAIDTSWGADIMVRNIKKGRNGTILIASNKGVFRYDTHLPYGQGTSFTNITSKISLPGLWFPDVLEDRNGNLWLIAWDFSTKPSKPGVYRYNSQEGLQHFTTKEGLANDTVNSIFEDKAGNIWFGTNGGASRYDGKSFQNFTTKEGLPGNNVGSILEDKTGKLWIVAGGLCFYDGKTFTVPSPFRIKDDIGFGISSITEDSKGNILFGSFKVTRKERISPGGVIYYGGIGLWRYDGSTITKVSERGASAIIEDKKGNIWTAGKLELNGKVWALSRFDQKSLYDKKPAVTEIMLGGQVMWVFANPGILEADDGSIWFGGFGSIHGVYRYDRTTITVF
jgi:ligand-binding sensor domain-containing protein